MQTALARPDRRPFPLPQDVAGELARSVSRAAAAAILAEIRKDGGRGEDILRRAWPGDTRAMAILTKTATAPATTTTAGWAAELAVTGPTAAFFENLQESAASALFAAALRLPLDGAGQVKVPYPAATPSLAPSFVAEGAPIPVRQAAFAVVTLAPRKLAVLTTLTNELNDHSTPVAEAVFRQVLTATAAQALDSAVFSTAAGDATRPPGLLNVTPITATAGGGQTAMLGDLKNLTAALATAGAGRRVMIFLPPALMASVAVYAPGNSIELIPTPALASSTTVVAVDPGGVVTGFSGQPEIAVARATVVHQEDSAPLQFSTGAPGSGTLATPMMSMFQSDSFALRLITLCFAPGAPARASCNSSRTRPGSGR